MSLIEQRYADKLGVTRPKAVTEMRSIFDTSPAPSSGGSLLSKRVAESDTFNNSVKSYESIKRNPAVFESAKRFLADRHGMTKVKDEDVIDEFISHFRSFDVNEMTTAGDFGYVSAAASDATKRDDEKAKMRLADYRLLYQTFREKAVRRMPLVITSRLCSRHRLLIWGFCYLAMVRRLV